jgi:hypothetical protein
MPAIDDLKGYLELIVQHDQDYALRNGFVISAMRQAHIVGLPVGIRIDPEEPEWPVVFIELPTGQVSWHIPQHGIPWDGHTTEEKFERIRRFIG